MDIGVQLFGCSKLFRNDPKGWLGKLAGMGYTIIEPCVSFGIELPFAWNKGNIAEYAGYVRELGMKFDSAHMQCKEPLAYVDEMIAVAKSVGIRRYVLGNRGPFDRASVEAFAAQCSALADRLGEAGIELWMHNNPPEIRAKMEGGLSAYETILRLCGGRLGAQIDTGWAVVGGEDLGAFLLRNQEYIRSIHHKDIASMPDEKGFVPNVALGTGIVDPRVPFTFAKERGLTQVMDQDNTVGDFEADLKESAACLMRLDAE